MKRTFRNAALALAVLLSPTAWAQTDAALGTWKLNVKQSSFKKGEALKAATLKFEAAGKGVKSWQQIVSAAGDTTTVEYTANYDGKDYAVKGSPLVEKVALKMKDARTVDRWDKKGGQVVQQFTRKVSADGKTMMVTQRATDAAGKPFENTMLFERQ